MRCGFGKMVNSSAPTRTEGRIHHDCIVLIADVQVFKRLSKDLAVKYHCKPWAKRHTRLNGRFLCRIRCPSRNSPMPCAWFKYRFASANIGQLHHLQADWLRRSVTLQPSHIEPTNAVP